jgi:hypothetical protein
MFLDVVEALFDDVGTSGQSNSAADRKATPVVPSTPRLLLDALYLPRRHWLTKSLRDSPLRG